MRGCTVIDQVKAESLFHQAVAHFQANRLSQAEALAKQSYTENPRHLGAILLLSRLAYLARRPNDAMTLLAEARSVGPVNLDVLLGLASLSAEIGDLDDSVIYLQEAAQFEPRSTRIRLQLGSLLARVARYAEAKQAFLSALDLDPHNGEAHVQLARFYQQIGQFESANAVAKQGLSIEPNNAALHYLLVAGGAVHSQHGELLSDLDRLLESITKPKDAMALHYARAKASEDLGRYREAMAHFDEANKLALGEAIKRGDRFDQAKMAAGLNALCSRFSNDFIDECAKVGHRSRKPIFIVGMPRTGTTLVEQIVSSHPEVEAAGELGTWKALASELFGKPGLPSRDEVNSVAEEYLKNLCAGGRDGNRVTDKTPQNLGFLGPIRCVFPGACILLCTRDPLDTALSIYTTAFGTGPDYAHSKRNIATAIREYAKLTYHWKRVIPDILEVHYEELVADPERVVRGMLSYLELDWSEACLSYTANPHAITTPSLWRARQPIYASSVGRWKKFEPWLGELGTLREG